MEKSHAILLCHCYRHSYFNSCHKMKLARIGINGNEKPVLIDSEHNYRDLSSIIKDLDTSTLNFETLEKIKKENIKNLPILDKSQRVGACVSNPSKFIGIGLNFKDHAIEQK